MDHMAFTEETSQEPMSWLKEVALANILDMSVTEEGSQVFRGWLKEVA